MDIARVDSPRPDDAVPAVARSYNVKSFTKYQTRHVRNPTFDDKPLIISMLLAIESSAFSRGLNGPCPLPGDRTIPFIVAGNHSITRSILHDVVSKSDRSCSSTRTSIHGPTTSTASTITLVGEGLGAGGEQ
jgi:hypothetical protein